MKIFLSGGCKNGKSYYAQRLAKAQPAEPHYYIATMQPVDQEDRERIARHQAERKGWGFITVEQHTTIEELMAKCNPRGVFLIDSMTALLANEMFLCHSGINEYAAANIKKGIAAILLKIPNIVIVSDYIYDDAWLYDPLTELFKKSLADIDRQLAQSCDAVLEITYGSAIIHKGGTIINELLAAIS